MIPTSQFSQSQQSQPSREFLESQIKHYTEELVKVNTEIAVAQETIEQWSQQLKALATAKSNVEYYLKHYNQQLEQLEPEPQITSLLGTTEPILNSRDIYHLIDPQYNQISYNEICLHLLKKYCQPNKPLKLNEIFFYVRIQDRMYKPNEISQIKSVLAAAMSRLQKLGQATIVSRGAYSLPHLQADTSPLPEEKRLETTASSNGSMPSVPSLFEMN